MYFADIKLNFTFQSRTNSFPQRQTTTPMVLSQGELHEEERETAEEEHHTVGDEEGTCRK